MIALLKRSLVTAVKLPFAMTWDVLSLGNMGEGSSTGKVLREHKAQKEADALIEAWDRIERFMK
jgi:hypothetical protein